MNCEKKPLIQNNNEANIFDVTEYNPIENGNDCDSPKLTSNIDNSRFERLIQERGLTVIYSKALRCGCMNTNNASPLPNCKICYGLGWFFIKPKQTKVLLQGLTYTKKWENWSEQNAGNVNITLFPELNPSYFDKIECCDLESTFSENCNIILESDIAYSNLIYTPTFLEEVFCFIQKSNEHKIKQLFLNVDFTIDKNKFILNNEVYEQLNQNDYFSVTLRYRYNPTFHVVDLVREEVYTQKDINCGEAENIQRMPIKVTAKRTHNFGLSKNISSSDTVNTFKI